MKIDVGLPMSIARMLTPKIQEIAVGMEINVRRIQEEEQKPLPEKQENISDLIITHQLSVMKNRDSMISSGHYETPGKMLPEMRPDLKEIGFVEPTGYFTTICLVPVVIIYNRLIINPPLSWHDLTDQRWKGRIGASSPEILRKLLKFYAKALLGKDAEKLISNVVFDGMPVDQNLKVDEGSLDTAIVPLPFTRASRNKNVTMCWPEEGAVCLPQVLIHKKGSLKQTLKISKYLLSENVQRFISETGMMIPVNPDAGPPPEVEKNNLNIFWKGWDWFIEGINSREDSIAK